MADNIKAPSHYVDGREYEPKDVIRDWGLNFNLGSAVKYISRAGRKGDKLEDLQKAKQFLEFEIEAVEEEASREEDEKRISAELLSRAVTENSMRFEDVPESLKPRVINNIAQEVLDSQIIPPDEVRAAVIDRIVGRIENGELDLTDIPNALYDECVRSRADIANSDYRKALDGIKKYAEDTEDTVSIKFEFEVDPDIDTDTINVHVYIKNKED